MISFSRMWMARYAVFLICVCFAVPFAFSQTTEQGPASKPAQAAQDSTSQPADSASQPVQVAAAQPMQDSMSQATQNPASNPCNPALTAGPAGTDPCMQAQNRQPADPTAPEVKPVAAIYTPALNGGPPIQVQQPRHLRWLYGLATTQGYDSDIAGPFSNIDSWTSSYEGYLAAAWRFTRSYVIIQQDTSYTYFGNHLLEGHPYNQTALLAAGDLDPNIGWIFEAHSFEGNNTLTELSPLPQIVINGVPVTSPGAATAGFDEGFIWGTDVVSTLNWKPDQRDIFSFRAENANQQFFDLDLHNNLTTLQLQYQRAFTRETTGGVYGLTRHETGTIDCDGVGFGLMASTKPTERWYLQASGGPEFDSGGCRRHQGFELHFAAVYKVRPTAWLYATANRQFSSGFLPNSTWEDDVSVGLSKQLTRRLTWNLSAGYVSGYIDGFTSPSTAGYRGFYGQTQFVQRLSRSFDFEATYRRYDQSSSGLSVNRNIVLFTLRWSPPNHDARRTAMYPNPPTDQIYDSRSGREE